MPQLANIVLAVGVAAVLYLMLARLKDELAAMLGSLLVLFTPVSLCLLQREYMDGFASMALPGIGGGLYILYQMRRGTIGRLAGALLLFFAGLFMAWGVAARYTNGLIAVVFALHFLTTRVHYLWKRRDVAVIGEALSIGLGAAIPLGLLLAYQQAVFGSALAYGYEYTKGNVKFAYDYWGSPRAWQIIGTNLANMWRPLLTGFPLLIAAIPGALMLIWEMLRQAVPPLLRFRREPAWSRLNPDLALLLIAWAAAIFGLYLMYEWTANQRADGPFIIVARFYLPALVPLSVMATFCLRRLPFKLSAALVLAALLTGGVLFAQSSQSQLNSSVGLVNPPGQANPPQSPDETARLIEQVRREVRQALTDASNMRRRFNVLVMWIGQLSRQPAYAGKLPPPAEIQHIQELVLQNRAAEAGALIDAAYAQLEQIVG